MYFDQNSLYHFGIFGMKWGVRRYQNEDGTLTEEGKKRYSRRQEDIELAKEYAEGEITKDKESRAFFQKEADAIRKIPATKSSIMKEFKLSEDEYKDIIDLYGSPEKYKESEAANYQNEADVHSRRIKSWNEKIDKLNKLNIDAISSDSEHMRKVEDIFSDAKGWLFRNIELHGLRDHIDAMRTIRRAHEDVEKQSDYESRILPKQLENMRKMIAQYKKDHPNTVLSDKEILLNRYGYVPKEYGKSSPKRTLTERFNAAQKDNPKLTYDQIYKEMKVDLNSDDPDAYKEAEAAWLKKHGY